jgi:tripartite-type tricarboxylate transporter receptor subunit TctC
MELFKMMTGTRVIRVSYKGIQQAIGDMIGGQVHMLFDNLPSILPHVKAGRVRPLAVTSLRRSSVVPELPTLDESGLTGFERVGWGGYIAHSQVPRAIIMQLNGEIRKSLNAPPVRERILGVGSTIVAGTPEEFGALLRKDTDKWAKVIKTVGMKAE